MKNILGSFVKLIAPHYLWGAVLEAVSYNGNALMFFLGSPQRYEAISKQKLDVQVFHQALKEHKISLNDVCIHLPYLINLANCSDANVFHRSVALMKKNLELCQYLQIKKVILHPGSALKNNRLVSLKQVVKGLDMVLKNYPDIQVCLETMSGKGSELGRTFAELKMIIENCQYSEQIAVCFDLCHLYSAGYDLVNHLDAVITEFDQIIGLNKLLVCHINDSKRGFKSHLDFHANLGQGSLGLPTIKRFVHHPQLVGKTMILETPYLDGTPLYKEEIHLLLNENQ